MIDNQVNNNPVIGGGNYTVRKGDTLDTISKATGIAKDEIIKCNKLKNENLNIGQELLIHYHSGYAAPGMSYDYSDPNIYDDMEQDFENGKKCTERVKKVQEYGADEYLKHHKLNTKM